MLIELKPAITQINNRSRPTHDYLDLVKFKI